MLKLFIFILIIAGIFAFWHFFLKKRVNLTGLSHHRHDLSKFLKDATSPKNRDKNLEKEIVIQGIDEIELEDQQLFDDVARLMFEKKMIQKNVSCAEQIQAEFLNKMPAQTQSQIGEFDLGEWCVFWTHHQQSLEYYVGRYGVFYTHVDQNGIEHKAEHKI